MCFYLHQNNNGGPIIDHLPGRPPEKVKLCIEEMVIFLFQKFFSVGQKQGKGVFMVKNKVIV